MRKQNKQKTSEQTHKMTLLKNPSTSLDTTILAQSSKLEGIIGTEGNLIVDGSVRGKITCGSLEIIRDGNVDAEVDAENVSVAGNFKGQLRCSGKLSILSTGKVVGQISYGILSIELGGLLDGTLARCSEKDRAILPLYQESK